MACASSWSARAGSSAVRDRGEGSLKGIEFPQFRLTGVGYGPSGQATLAPPGWPQVQVEQQEKLDGALFMRVFSSLAALASKR